MGLSQEKVGRLFGRCDSPEETEEVLQAYAFVSVGDPALVVLSPGSSR